MIARRTLSAGLAAMALIRPAWAEVNNIEEVEERVRQAREGQATDVMLGGKILPPTYPAWKDAYRILTSAPRGQTPYQVAEYFKQRVPERYQSAWPAANANPIIVEFFWDIDDMPAGDTTAWCAAFVNWCLKRAGVTGTHSPGSQSFIKKNWGRGNLAKGRQSSDSCPKG